MRTNYLDRMREGVSGRMWYDDSSNDISRWTGGNPEKSDLMANMLATTSSGTPVGANLMYANKAWNQNLTGAPFNTGKYPTAMGKSIAGAMDSPQAAELGLKGLRSLRGFPLIGVGQSLQVEQRTIYMMQEHGG